MEGETGRDRDLIVNLSDGLLSLTLVLFREVEGQPAVWSDRKEHRPDPG